MQRSPDGAAWSQVENPTTAHYLYGVDMVSAADGWAVNGYPGKILHWDGQAWSVVFDVPYGRLLSLSMLSPTDGWAAGGDTFLHYTGIMPDYHSYLPVILNMP